MNKKIIAFVSLNLCFFYPFHESYAAEKLTPFQPGASTGVAIGTLPPPNVYLTFDTNIHGGPVLDHNGNKTAVKTFTVSNAARILVVPGWTFFGAKYAAAVTQLYEVNNTHNNATGKDQFTDGLFNTFINPEILSWRVTENNYIAETVTIYLPDGKYDHAGSSTTAYAFANNYMTFEPGLFYSYVGNGWNLSLANYYEFNTKNTATDYHSGSTYFLDWTAARHFGKFELGLIGNYTQQITPDTQFGKEVSNVGGGGYGNKYMYTSIGPMVNYKFGKTTLSLRYLQAITGRNGGAPSFFHIGFSLPLG